MSVVYNEKVLTEPKKGSVKLCAQLRQIKNKAHKEELNEKFFKKKKVRKRNALSFFAF